MGLILKRTSFVGPRSRGYRCRVESLESRSMMAADVIEAAFDPVPDEMTNESIDPIAVDEWQAWDPAVCELQSYDFCELQPHDFVDPFVQISDYGDGRLIVGFPLELAPPVPEQTVFDRGDQSALDAYADDGTVDPSGSLYVVNDWSSYGTEAVLTSDENAEFGDDGTSTWDDSGVLYFGDFSILPFSSGWTCTLLPSAYARGADVSESFAAYAAAADAEPAESVAVSPRSAAFADMGTMAAAATEMQASSADAMPVGRRRRR